MIETKQKRAWNVNPGDELRWWDSRQRRERRLVVTGTSPLAGGAIVRLDLRFKGGRVAYGWNLKRKRARAGGHFVTTHELARKLLEGPDQLVVIQAHEPNEDTFDEIERADSGKAWRYWSDLHDSPPPKWRGTPLGVAEVNVTVLR